MRIAELAVKRPVFTTSVFLLILALGAVSRFQLSTALYPNVSFPVVNVVVPFPGAGPEEIEAQVSKPIEAGVNSIPGINTVRSLSQDNVGIITAVFSMDSDLRFAEQKVQQVVTHLRSDLPSGIREPMIRTVDPSDTPVLTLSLSADLKESELFDLAYSEVRPMLEQVPQVGQVEVVGARKREIQVELGLDQLKSHEMSAEEVVGRLSAAGMNIPVGQIDDPKHETIVRSIGEFDSLDAIRQTPIRFVGNEAATILKEVATVRDGLEDEKNRVYINGTRGMVLRVYKNSGANTVQVSDGLSKRVEEIRQSIGPKYKGFKLDVLRDGAKSVREGIRDANEAVYFGVFLTVFVVLLFLGNFRSTLITALALPNSLLGAFLFMWIAGFSINITTMAALALAVGLLIDDAIVVRENIFRRMEQGESPRVAALAGTTEVALAVIATTLTVLSVFGPVSFLHGIIGQFFKEFGLTICFAMLISLLDSLTIAPMLSSILGGSRKKEGSSPLGAVFRWFEKWNHFQAQIYGRVLDRTLRSPLIVIVGALLIFVISLGVLAWIPKSFIPSQESGEFQVLLGPPVGTSLDATDALAREVDSKIRSHPEVERTVVTVGGDVGEKHAANLLVLLKPSKQRHLSTSESKEKVRADLRPFAYARPEVNDIMEIGGGAGKPFVVQITGEDLDGLKSVTADLVDRLNKGKDLQEVKRSYGPGSNELRWVFDPVRAREFGISTAEAGHELRLLLAGDVPAHFHEDGHLYDIRVRLMPEQRDLRQSFSKIMIPNLNHRLVPLTEAAHRVDTETPAQILRQDRKRFIEISGDLSKQGRGLQAAIDEVKHLFDSGELKHSPGISYRFGGMTKDFQELTHSMILAVSLSVVAMFLVLASLYESFFIPLSIMLVLPLAFCGAFYALGMTHSHLDIYSMVGCVLLMGVAAKNSILLVDYIQEGIRSGKSLQEALLNAGRLRLRPIMMTSFALIAGMLPMALPLQESAKERAPMAIAVIGGVISSTLLTLVVVPAAYEYILRAQNLVLRWTRGLMSGR